MIPDPAWFKVEPIRIRVRLKNQNPVRQPGRSRPGRYTVNIKHDVDIFHFMQISHVHLDAAAILTRSFQLEHVNTGVDQSVRLT